MGLQGSSTDGLARNRPWRVPVDKIVWMLGQYRTHHMGWNVKHFHEHIRKQHGFRWGYLPATGFSYVLWSRCSPTGNDAASDCS